VKPITPRLRIVSEILFVVLGITRASSTAAQYQLSCKEKQPAVSPLYFMIRVCKPKALLFAAAIATLQCAFAQRFSLQAIAFTGNAPSGRMGAATRSIPNSELVVTFGGQTGNTALGDTWIFDASANNWTNITRPGPPPRFDALTAVVDWGTADGGTYFYVIGGRDNSGVLQTSLVWAFCVSNASWTEVQLFTSNTSKSTRIEVFGRSGAAGGSSSSGDIFISHGQDSRGTVRSDMHLVTLRSPLNMLVMGQIHGPIRDFTVGEPHALQLGGSAITLSDQLVLYGGCYENGMCPQQDTWLFDLSRRHWRYMSRGPSPRIRPCLASAFPSMDLAPDLDAHNTVILWGGLERGRHYIRVDKASPFEIDVLDTARKTWTREIAVGDESISKKRFGAAMVAVGNGTSASPFRFIILGGAEEGGHLPDSGLVLTFDPSRPSKVLSTAAVRYYAHLFVHGIFMGIAFSLMVPTGLFASRYMRFSTSSPEWFTVHIVSQSLGAGMAWIGLIFALIESKSSSHQSAHTILGVFVMSFVTLQLLSGLPGIRPNPNAGLARQIWGGFHFLGGWIACILGAANVLLGLILVVSPTGIWVAYATVLSIISLMLITLETVRCVRADHKSERYTEQIASYKTPDERMRQKGETVYDMSIP
jgi:Eukaryotic cytochrome b561/Galactose oxidase, central domain